MSGTFLPTESSPEPFLGLFCRPQVLSVLSELQFAVCAERAPGIPARCSPARSSCQPGALQPGEALRVAVLQNSCRKPVTAHSKQPWCGLGEQPGSSLGGFAWEWLNFSPPWVNCGDLWSRARLLLSDGHTQPNLRWFGSSSGGNKGLGCPQVVNFSGFTVFFEIPRRNRVTLPALMCVNL